jgi:hypothetical protein
VPDGREAIAGASAVYTSDAAGRLLWQLALVPFDAKIRPILFVS